MDRRNDVMYETRLLLIAIVFVYTRGRIQGHDAANGLLGASECRFGRAVVCRGFGKADTVYSFNRVALGFLR